MTQIVTLLKNLTSIDDIREFRESLKSGIGAICSSDPLVSHQFGSNLLNQFIQFNWTGPKEEEDTILPFIPDEFKAKWDRACLEDEYDGETWYDLTNSPHLLSLSGIILIDNMIEDCKGFLWGMRCLCIQQQLLNVNSSTLWNRLQSVIEKLIKLLKVTEMKREDLCTVHLEISNCLLYHAQYDRAMDHLKLAQQSTGISLELSGALGKRTKFQESETAQLLLKVSHCNGDDVAPIATDASVPNRDLPKDVLLEDDTLLNRVAFTKADHHSVVLMSPVQQAVVLCECVHHRWTSPVHRLTTEQLEAYLEQLLSQPQCWVIQSMALYLRSVFERKKSRAMERSMMQLQELVDLYSKPLPKAAQRLELFYCVSYPPCWIVEKEFADTLVQLGTRQSALEVYERLHLWDEVISCYQAVGRHSQAERVVRERMAEEGESVKLWCLLGDASQDHTCYERAWELSNHRSARAQKSLGLYFLSKENFKECVECLQKSVNINPMQSGLWFTLGHAASKLEDHSMAAHAFRQCVTLQPDNYEAWNNLAGEYVKRKDKVRAFNAFQEALKCNYENWKIWENYLIVSTDIGEFEETVRAYHRMLDIKRKHLDAEILGYLTDGVVDDIVMRNGKQASSLRSKLGELLARVVAQTTGSSELWEVCSKFHLSSSDLLEREKGLTELQKAQRTARQTPGWETDAERRKRVLDLTLRYSEACRANKRKETFQRISSSARLCLQGVISKLKDVMELEADKKELFDEMIGKLTEEQKRLEVQGE